VSVIVPMRNAAGTVDAQLDALEVQDYEGAWEVVVADNGSGDGSTEIVRRRVARLPGGRIVECGSDAHRGPGRARNAGAEAARGDFFAFCDADDVVAPTWLRELVAAARGADLVAGRLDVEPLNSPEVRAWHAAPEWLRLRPIHRFLPNASTANCGIWRDVFDAVGRFEDTGSVNEDKELSWRVQVEGRRLARAPDAVVAYRYRASAWATARQYYAWGEANPRLFRRYRAHGMRRANLVDAVRTWTWIVAGVALLPFSAAHRGRWALRTAERVGHVVGSIRHRVVFL
jgi:glycosyltransferase involved in cell wall biosynthesis